MSDDISLIDARAVRRNFARRAHQSDTLADLLAREIGQRMLERLLCIKLNPVVMLDAGTGRGAVLKKLREHYPQAAVLAVDHCLEVLQRADRTQHAAGWRHWLARCWLAVRGKPRGAVFAGTPVEISAGVSTAICADFAQLPLRPATLDLVWSNLALHWHHEPAHVFAEWQRVLRPEGLVMFSCFGPDTLKEVRRALGSDAVARIMPLIDMHDLGDQLVRQGFGDPVMDMEQLTLTYATPQQLLREVASLGGNPLRAQPRGMLSRQRYQQWLSALQTLAGADGRICLTLEVIYGHAWKPQSKSGKNQQQRTAEGHVVIPLDQLRGKA